MNGDRLMYDLLRNKPVQVMYELETGNGRESILMTGQLTHMNDSFIVLKNREGKVRFIATKIIVGLKELNSE